MMEFLIIAAVLNLCLFLLIPEVRAGLLRRLRANDGHLTIKPPAIPDMNYQRAYGVREPGARPMPSHSSDRLLHTGWHWTFGWLRRPEMDDENGFCYEDGDGTLYFTQKRAHKVALLLDCWETEQGERYLAFHPIPAPAQE